MLAFSLAVPTGMAAATSPGQRTAASSLPGDRAATHALLQADYELARATLARVPAMEAAEAGAAEALGHQCKDVLRGAPDESVTEEEGPYASQHKLSGRAQGERARSEREKQVIELEIEETIAAAASAVLRGPYEAYVTKLDGLAWSNPTIDALIHERTARLREEMVGPPVAACAEMRTWAASGFHLLAPATRGLEETREAGAKQAVQGNIGMLLRPYEGPADQLTIRRTTAVDERLTERERADEVSSRAEYHMNLALGEQVSRFAAQQIAPVIARGRTNAGTTFVIRRHVNTSSPESCRHEVYVELNKRKGGSSSGLCLDKQADSHPSSDCLGSLGTVELATPPGVPQARVRLGNGQTVTIPVAQIPAKEGGPGGVLIYAYSDHKPHPVSVQELNSVGKALRTVVLTRVSCATGPAAEAPGPPQPVDLATVTTPSGETLAIEGMLQRFRGQTELSLVPSSGVRNAAAGEETQARPKQFQWNLSTECAPHPYSLLDGILLPPGAAVLVRAPAGLTPLTKIELSASLHAEGPLFYGVYTTPPTEVVVERSDGSVLYTESLTAKASEETEFCEGYAER